MKKLFLLRIASVVLLITFNLSSALASTLYGGGNGFYSIDPSTGLDTLIDSDNADYRKGLAYNPLTNTMYGLGLSGRLSSVDLNTGATTLVGSSSFQVATGLSFNNDFSVLYSLSNNGGDLLAINPLDGSAVTIGATTGGITAELDLATDSSGTLYAGGLVSGISTINTSTGATTLIGGSLGWSAIAFDENDVLYGIELRTDALYIIDTVDGSATLVGGTIGDDIRGMAFVTSAVPAPSALWLFGSGLLGLIGVVRRR